MSDVNLFNQFQAQSVLKDMVYTPKSHADIVQQVRAQLESDASMNALDILNQLLKTYGTRADILCAIGQILFKSGRFELALKTYLQAGKQSPDNTDIINAIASCHMVLGHFDDALKYYRKSAKLQPENIQTLASLVFLQPLAPADPLITRALALHATPDCQGEIRATLCFTLGKVYDANGDTSTAYRFFEEANRIKNSLVRYDEAGYFTVFDKLEKIFTGDYVSRLANASISTITPIFVLGMPRSGTSLVEQILASHPSVYGAGEVDLLTQMAEKFIPDTLKGTFPDALASLDSNSVAMFAEHYVKKLKTYRQDASPFIVDKTPYNFYLVGLIRILFPYAIVINCKRDPIDNCWSLYRHHFSGTHPYTFDQQNVGRFYRRYKQLMAHWHRALPRFIHDVSYEQLIAEPKQTIAALLEHCRLPWNEKCLKFYHTQRTVATASARQVRRPLYSTSIKSWEPVADQLLPMRRALGLA